LLGPSGCGKTTTLRLVAGLEEPDGGEIYIDGQIVAAPQRGVFLPPEKRQLGMVFQSYAIWPHLTVFENVAFPLRVRHESTEVIRQRVDHALESGGLGDFLGRTVTLEGTLKKSAGSQWIELVAGGRIAFGAHLTDSLLDGAAVRLIARPEDIEILPPAELASTQIDAAVEQVDYLGDRF